MADAPTTVMTVSQANASDQIEQGPLALICGGGTLPVTVADIVERRGRRVVMFPVRGWVEPATVERFRHHWITPIQAGRFQRLAHAEGCRDVVFLGSAVRPPFRSLRLDWGSLKSIPLLWRAYRGGDDHLLSGIARAFHEFGFRIVGAHEVAPEILVPAGPVGAQVPKSSDLVDIRRGLDLLHAMGPFDVGQAAVIANRQVVAVEAVEGTDGMLANFADLRARGRIAAPRGVGVLVKAPKPGQDRRYDMPAIGPRTVEAAANAGLAGIAVVAGSTIIAEPQDVARAADTAGLFVFGIEDEPPK